MVGGKNSTGELYIILGRADLHWDFFSKHKDDSDIHRFSNRKYVLTTCTVGNPLISGASLNILGKFQRRSNNCAAVFDK